MKHFKSFICTIISIALATAVLTSVSSASDDNFVVENGVLTQYKGVSNDVFIPDDLGITEIGEKAFYENKSIKLVIISYGVKSIGDQAFGNCTELAGVQIPSTVNEIGSDSFVNCSEQFRIIGTEDTATDIVYPLSYVHNYAYEHNIEYYNCLYTDIEWLWIKGPILSLTYNQIISGVGDFKFEPDRYVTRAEFIKMIVKLMEYDTATDACSFTDVAEDAWYYSYVATAYEHGVIDGYGNELFGPDDNISREDMVVIFTRILGLRSGDVNSSLSNFADSSDISTYARDAVAACFDAEFIIGEYSSEGTMFNPKRETMRSEAAVMTDRAYKRLYE